MRWVWGQSLNLAADAFGGELAYRLCKCARYTCLQGFSEAQPPPLYCVCARLSVLRIYACCCPHKRTLVFRAGLLWLVASGLVLRLLLLPPQVVVSEDTVAAVQAAEAAGRSTWRVSSTVFAHIASDEELRPLGHFAQDSAGLYPPTLAGIQVGCSYLVTSAAGERCIVV